MSVSIIIPVYNKESKINNTIKSVLSQSFKDFEVIIIDDGSTDKSAEIIKGYCNKDSRIKYFYTPNKGVSLARNLGIRLANRKYISFLDADDEWDQHFLKEMLISVDNGDVAYCGHYNKIGQQVYPAKIKFETGNILVNYIKNVTTPNTNSWLIRKKLLKKYNIKFPENTSWGEDMSFFIKVLIHCHDTRSPKKYLTYYHRDVKGSLSSQDPKKIFYDIEWMKKSIEYISLNLKDIELVQKSKDAFLYYRIPSAIIYRLNQLFEEGNIETTLKIYNELQDQIAFIPVINGLRSLKLLISKYNLQRKLKKINN